MLTIPKPKSLRFKTTLDLHYAMVKTHPDRAMFEEFKHWIRYYARNMDPLKLKEQYSVNAWAAFLDKILLVQPELTFYEAYWPVDAYFDSYTRQGLRFKTGHKPKKSRKRFKNATVASKIFYNDELENADPSSSRQSLNIRDTQQSMSSSSSNSRFFPSKSSDKFGSRLDNIASRSRSLSARSQRPEWHSTNAIASSSSNTVPMLRGLLTPKNNHVDLDASSQISVEDHLDMKEILVLICCGNTTTVKSTFNNRLVRLVGSVDLLESLAKLGIFLDQHLDELLHLKHDDVMEFFSDVASDLMTPLAKLHFIKSLQDESFNIRKQQTLHSPFISCPPLERQLSNPYSDWFQKATKLEDHDFRKLMNTMRTLSQDYITIYRPDADQLGQVVTAICGDCRLLRQYENLWPLKIFLKHQSNLLRTSPRYSELEADVVFSKVFKNQRRCELPTLVQLPCNLHPLIDISQVPHTLKTRLHSLGIAGLIPAFAYVGIHSDAHFADFCKLNDQERDDLFILAKLKLTQFQRFILHLALSMEHFT